MINLIGMKFTTKTTFKGSDGKWITELADHVITKANVKNYNGFVSTKSKTAGYGTYDLQDVLNILGLKFEQVAQ